MANKKYSLEDKKKKVKAIQNAMASGAPLAVACREFGVRPAMYRDWIKLINPIPQPTN